MSTRDELAGVLSKHEHIVFEGRDVIAGAPEDIAETVHAEGWRKKPSREELREAIGPARRRIWLDPEDIEEMVADVLALMEKIDD